MPRAEGKRFNFDSIDKIQSNFLELFLYKGSEQLIRYETDEFSAVCPFSGLPDYGKLTIEYIPHEHCLELKSLKYYIVSFRNVGVFQENATNIIFDDLWELLTPKYLKILLIYNKRGGVDSVTEIHRGLPSSSESKNKSLRELIVKNRSTRRFYEDFKIEESTLKSLVDLARLSPSSRNRQFLKFIISNQPELNLKIFKTLSWAAKLKDWSGPSKGERPSAYIVILLDKRINQKSTCDHGIASQSILLGAVETGLSGCIIANINRAKLAKELKLTDDFEILLVLALGKGMEEIVIEEAMDDKTDYYRDNRGVHHVPKRSLGDIIIKSD